MSLVGEIKDFVSSAVEAFEDAVKLIWGEAITPTLEEIAGVFGIEDETVVQVSKGSVRVFEQDVNTLLTDTVKRAVVGKNSDRDESHSFFDHYWYQLNATRASFGMYYKYGLDRYVHGIPDAVAIGTSIDEAGAQAAVTAQFGAFATVLSAVTAFPTAIEHFRNVLQAPPYFYKPASNTFTYTDSLTSTVYTDWVLSYATLNYPPVSYTVGFYRTAQLAEFWITGDSKVVEGNTASYTVRCTRTVPSGKSVTINLIYSGVAASGNYTPTASVVMLSGTNEVSFTVPTTANALVDGNRTFTISIGNIVNTSVAFERVSTRTPSTISTTIYDNDSPTLLVSDGVVVENSNATLNVTLINTPGTGFTVNYTTVAGTALADIDYTTTSGTLTFTGILNEVRTITVPILSDIENDDGETFYIQLSNCSNPSVNITSQGTVVIANNPITYPPTTMTVYASMIQPSFTKAQSVIIRYYLSNTDPSALDWKYWIYDVASNTYPSLSPVFNAVTNFELLPIVMLRKNGVSLNNYGTVEQKKSARELLLRLNLNLEELIDNVEASPSIGVIRDAYLNIGVNPLDTGQAISKLLWHIFYPIVVENPVTSSQEKFFLAVEQESVQNAIVWSAQSHETVSGYSGYPYHHFIIFKTLHIVKATGFSGYEKIIISNLGSLSTIKYENHHEMASNALGQTDFTIPVPWYALKQLTAKEQLEIHGKIVRLDFYALQVTQIDWYFTQDFQTLVRAGLFTLTAFSLGTAGAAAQAIAITGGATGSAAANAFVFAVIKEVVIGYSVSAIVSKIAKETGNELLAASAGLAIGVTFAPNLGDLSKLGGMLDPDTLLELSINFANNLSNAYKTVIAMSNEELSKEAERFNRIADARINDITQYEHASAINEEFIGIMRSIDELSTPAVQGIYEFDLLYDYDRLTTDYNDNLLRVGTV